MRRFSASPLVLAITLAAGCGDPPDEPVAQGRPVTVLTLSEATPPAARRVTGVVEPYRQADVGFEVSGRLEWVVDLGTEVRGAVLEEDGALALGEDGLPIQRGDVLGVVDAKRYRQKVEAVQLSLAAARTRLAAQRVELEQVTRNELLAAESNRASAELDVSSSQEEERAAAAALDLATTTLERARELVEQGVSSQEQLDRATSDFEQARARSEQAKTAVQARENALEAAEATLAKSRGAIALKEAQLASTDAEIAQLVQELTVAESDLADCVLRAPFSGRVTGVLETRGAMVQAGTPVLELTLLDPMKVVLTVSPRDDRELAKTTRLKVFAPDPPAGLGGDDYVWGTIRSKGQIADPTTRTYRIELMVRNWRRHAGTDRAVDFVPVVERLAGEGGPPYVFEGSIWDAGGEPFVLRVPGMNLQGERRAPRPGPHHPERVPITTGDGRTTIVHWAFREVVSGDLATGDVILIRPDYPSGVAVAPDELIRGGVELGAPEWTLRPGELVTVDLEAGTVPPGFYVPVTAIVERNGRTSVFALDGDVAREVPVTSHEAWRESRRVEGPGLVDGGQVIHGGVHYVSDGDRVRVRAEAR